ncbi:MAG: HNH endonuclease signature motif containing protein [Draconibacterium sp.]|nr:HNH endonuclease signature motif containing protein [Draconibacterium sp.]
MANNNWTKEELILTFNLYLKIPFGKFHRGNKEVIDLATLINRTPSAVAMRLSNFASVDPYHKERGVGGLPHGKKQVKPIWDEFNENKEELIFESEKILANLQDTSIEKKYTSILEGTENLQGETKIREVKTRINQNVFRQIVLANYSRKCAITGFSNLNFLIASHITPWSIDKQNRLNPQNGILLNNLHDKAFENGFMAINKNYEILICSEFLKSKDSFVQNYFASYHNKKMNLPIRFLPDNHLLERHLEERFLG